METRPLVIVMMGVAGSGKTTVGRLLAAELKWHFWDADSFHSEANIEKMRAGDALSDAERRPWLLRVRQLIDDCVATRQPGVIACSSLKESYRQTLRGSQPDAVRFVYLRGPRELFRARLAARTGHFAGAELLESQLQTLEEPGDAMVVDAAQPPAAIVDAILTALAFGR